MIQFISVILQITSDSHLQAGFITRLLTTFTGNKPSLNSCLLAGAPGGPGDGPGVRGAARGGAARRHLRPRPRRAAGGVDHTLLEPDYTVMKDLLRVVTAYMSAPPAWLGPLSAWVSSHPDTVRCGLYCTVTGNCITLLRCEERTCQPGWRAGGWGRATGRPARDPNLSTFFSDLQTVFSCLFAGTAATRAACGCCGTA